MVSDSNVVVMMKFEFWMLSVVNMCDICVFGVWFWISVNSGIMKMLVNRLMLIRLMMMWMLLGCCRNGVMVSLCIVVLLLWVKYRLSRNVVMLNVFSGIRLIFIVWVDSFLYSSELMLVFIENRVSVKMYRVGWLFRLVIV